MSMQMQFRSASICPSKQRSPSLKPCRSVHLQRNPARVRAAAYDASFNSSSSNSSSSSSERLLKAAEFFADALLPGRDGELLKKKASSFLNTIEGQAATSAGEKMFSAAADAIFNNGTGYGFGSRHATGPAGSSGSTCGNTAGFHRYHQGPGTIYQGESYERVVKAAQDLINAAVAKRNAAAAAASATSAQPEQHAQPEQTPRPQQPEYAANSAPLQPEGAQVKTEAGRTAAGSGPSAGEPAQNAADTTPPVAAPPLQTPTATAQVQVQQHDQNPAQGKTRRKVVSVYMQPTKPADAPPAAAAPAAASAAPATAAELQQLQEDVQNIKVGMQEVASLSAVQTLQWAISNISTSDSHFEFVTTNGTLRHSKGLVKSIFLGWMQGRDHMLPRTTGDVQAFHNSLVAICCELTGVAPLIEVSEGRFGPEYMMRCPKRFGGKLA